MYPVMLNISKQRCLVVGGGGVAVRKVEGLLSEGARVTVVASEPTPALVELGKHHDIELEQRLYRDGEAGDYVLAFAATDDREVNRRVFEDAQRNHIWANVADDPELCSFHLPARIKRGTLQLAIASAGEAPFVVRRLRQMLERKFGEEWSEWVEAAARFRQSVRELNLSTREQEERFDLFFSRTVNTQSLTARVPKAVEEQAWLETSGSTTPSDQAPSCGQSESPHSTKTQNKGLVSLIGSGPGDAGLLTLRGRQRLMGADAVVYDYLAITALPCDLPACVELHPVGKHSGHHPVPQEEINALLVRLAKAGKRVVRLKGGDPFVFGRGGEEAQILAEAGVPFEVVPSVTAGIAVPAYAGIPVTLRQKVVRLTLVTAHESKKEQGPQVRWDLLAADPHATLVGYMGVTSLPQVVERLTEAGMDPTTPAAMVERGTTTRQRTVISTLAELPSDSARAKIKPPALFVIGPSVSLGEKLDWFGTRPLLGLRLVVPAPVTKLHEALEMAGAEVLEVPLPVSPAARVVMGVMELSGCVFSSADEVEALEDERDGPGWNNKMTAWCLTPQTAEKANALGWRRVEEIPGGKSHPEIVDHLLNSSHQG